MKVTIETSKGEMRMIDMPLNREEEEKLLKKIDDNEGRIAVFNTLAPIIQLLRS